MRLCKLCLLAIVIGFLCPALGACVPRHPPVTQLNPDASAGKSAQELREYGQASLDDGKADVAAQSFESALQMDAGDNQARLGLAESYLKLKENDKAYDAFRALMPVKGYKPAVLQGIGLVELQRGNFEAAEGLLKQAVSEDTSLWRAWNGLGQLYDFQGKWVASNEAYQESLGHTSKSYFIYNNMGVSYMAQKEFKKAAEMFQKALRDKPDLDIAKTNYRLALALQERYDEATIESDGSSEAKSLNNAGYAAMMQGKYKEAERLFIKAIEVYPSFYKTPYYNLQVLNQLKQKQN
jgi:Tfp pilus assembly protein PilF